MAGDGGYIVSAQGLTREAQVHLEIAGNASLGHVSRAAEAQNARVRLEVAAKLAGWAGDNLLKDPAAAQK